MENCACSYRCDGPDDVRGITAIAAEGSLSCTWYFI